MDGAMFGGYGAAKADEAGMKHHEMMPPRVSGPHHEERRPTQEISRADEGPIKSEKVPVPDVQEKLALESEEDGLDYNVTDEDRATLRRVAAPMPWTAFLIGICELAERFSYYGTTQVFQNMIQNPLPAGSTTGRTFHPDDVAGVYGKGQQAATGITTFNTFWVYVNPLIGGYIADTYLGRFNTICLGVGIAIVGHILFIISAIPSVIKDLNGAFACFIIGVIINGVGTGFFKSTVSVLIAEQIKAKRQYIQVTKKGERVIVDPTATAARLYDFFYLLINIGALVDRSLCRLRKSTSATGSPTRSPPSSSSSASPSSTLRATRPLLCQSDQNGPQHARLGLLGERQAEQAWRHEAKLDDVRRPVGRRSPSWIQGLLRLPPLPFYWLVYNQISGNLVSQGGTMKLGGVPNEIPQNLDPLGILILVPFFEFVVYPGFRRMGINFTALKKIFCGFIVASMSMVWAAVLQHYIYTTSPCGTNASSDPGCQSPISVWVQVGPYVLIGLSELFASVISLEYAYTKAPKNMRSLVMGVGLFTNAIGSAIQQAFLPLAKNPLLVWMYTTFACISFAAGILFGFLYRGIDKEEDYLNNLASADYHSKRSSQHEEWDMHNADHASNDEKPN
ncbi:hypothetical protein L7F22_010060 [Adiantum nelumboides]|nr:hypothetical protein [Adiantum nelumboides]